MSYRGYERKDEIAGRLACIFAIGVALVPTAPDLGGSLQDKLIGGLHLSFAGLLFLTFAYFSLVLFIKTAPDKTPTRQKLKRNTVYRICGYTIVACIFFSLLSRICGSIPVLEVFPACDRERFPWLQRYENHRIV